MVTVLPEFSDREYWEKELQDFVGKTVYLPGENENIWEYFKFCLQTQNRFYFQNPLIPLILEKFRANTFILKKGKSIYRSRIDYERKLENQCWMEKDIQDLKRMSLTVGESNEPALSTAIYKYYLSEYTKKQKEPEYREFLERYSRGFEGFDAKESGAAPYNLVKAGRCNPEHVSYLYAASDEHTAVAEVRPFIRDAISIATLNVKRDLKLVDFYFEYDERGCIDIKDVLFHCIRSEFTRLNKGNAEEYLVTQYLSSMAQYNGFDGIRFRSSLVYEGTNYVIFDNENCDVVCSKMYIIPAVQYTLQPILNDDYT